MNDTSQFLHLVALAQRPGTSHEGANAVTLLAKRMEATYPVVWTIPARAVVLVPGTHQFTGAQTVDRYVVVEPMRFDEASRVKTPELVSLFSRFQYLCFRRDGVSHYCQLADVIVKSL